MSRANCVTTFERGNWKPWRSGGSANTPLIDRLTNVLEGRSEGTLERLYLPPCSRAGPETGRSQVVLLRILSAVTVPSDERDDVHPGGIWPRIMPAPLSAT